jgi:hypothetical protein
MQFAQTQKVANDDEDEVRFQELDEPADDLDLEDLRDEEAAQEASDASLLEFLDEKLEDDTTLPMLTHHDTNVGRFAIHKVHNKCYFVLLLIGPCMLDHKPLEEGLSFPKYTRGARCPMS